MHRPLRSALVPLLALLALAGAPGDARAQTSLEQVESTLAGLAEEIRGLEARAGETGAAPLEGRLERLRALERTYERQRELLRSADALAAREQDAQERVASGPSGQLAKPPPYLLAVLDALADARDAQRQRSATLSDGVEAAREARSAADAALEAAEKERRRLAEAVERAKGEAGVARLRQQLDAAELASRSARAQQQLAALELASLERKLALQEADAALLDETVGWVRDNLALDVADADAASDALADERFEAQRALERAEQEVADAERNLAAAEQRLEEDPESPVRRAEVAARGAELALWQRRAEAATTTLSRLDTRASLEERRVRALSGDASRAELLAWEEELAAARAETGRSLRLLDAQQAELAADIARARGDLARAEGSARPWIEREIAALEGIAALREDEAASWKRLDVLAARVESELAEITARPGLRDRLADAWRAAGEAWSFELMAVDDRSITLGKIATALFLFAAGFVVARVLSRLMGRLLVSRISLAPGAATAIQGLVFYVLLLVFFLFALRTVNIPLTAFTVLGGALAIGVGFGSQNVVNNFISGLILLAERPIKVGDMIEVDGQRGTVEWIGARSTRIRTFDNIHMVVPNSAFLEKNVINWTLTDDDIRTCVDVGVAYGSPTREVQRLLLRAVEEHGKILDRPGPVVLFRAFGDSSLDFRVYFWIRSRDMLERLTIESDVRYRIDHLCREGGITIAFPQRDVHLDAKDPLAVRLLPAEPGQ